ncbi:hypothetical protein [Sphingopyxis sp. PET50]|uniref:hypothetical protein n=1 Tax=Sphingopyxis sp. PET50 TaxID=2976533 RepID=UPI0021B04208|nr:hypothetical protein [Sphingopyxis sp. PET50]
MATESPSTEIAVAEKPKKVPVQAGGKLAAMIPTDVDQAYRMAQALARSSMTPKSYGNDPDKIFVGIIAGAEVGLAPFMALQSIAVIGNNPAIWGDGALALVQGSGLLIDMEETDDGNEATCRLVRKGRETPIIRTFSMEDAKKAGLAGKQGPWTQYPQRMRQMRARAWAMRDGFADVLKGIGIAEEVKDFAVVEGGEVAAQPLTRAMLQQQAEEVEPADTLTPDNPTAAEGRDDTDMGEDHVDEEHPARAAVDAHLKRIAALELKSDVDLAISDFSANKAALPDDMRAEVEDAEHNRLMRFSTVTGG